jgi:hypothetical protein
VLAPEQAAGYNAVALRDEAAPSGSTLFDWFARFGVNEAHIGWWLYMYDFQSFDVHK